MRSRLASWAAAAVAAVTVALVPAQSAPRPSSAPVQAPAPSPAPPPAQPATPAPAPPAAPETSTDSQPVFRSGVRLVLVDVSVSGNDDEPIGDLTPADFELTEDGVPQVVEQATLVRLDGTGRGRGESLAIRSQDHAIAEAGRDDVRLFAVFMDDYHLGRFPQDVIPLRRAMTDFLNSLGPLDMVTVMNPITPLSGLRWTRDKAALVREFRNYEGRIDNFVGRSPLEDSQTLSRNIFRVRSQVVISALQALVMHLSGLREGRKTLLVVSQGIPLNFDVNLEPDFQALLREANRGNVVIHTMDPRGLGQGNMVHNTMLRMATETGGRPIVNTNNLSKGLERLVQDASHHYLIGYAPTRELNDGRFHRIAVRVKRKGARTVARRGYWAPSEAEMTPVMAPVLEPAVSTALTTLQSRREDRVAHVELGFARGAAGAVRLTATWSPVPGFRDRPARLAVDVRDEQGAPLGTGEAALAAEGTGIVHVDVPPGPALVRFSAANAAGDVVDRWEEPVTVPDLSGATLAVATPMFVRARTTAAFQALRRGDSGAPSPDREFRPTDLIVVRTAVADDATPAATMTAEILTRRGKVLTALPAPLVNGHYQVDLPLRSLALGEYVLRFTASRGEATATTTAGFAIIR